MKNKLMIFIIIVVLVTSNIYIMLRLFTVEKRDNIESTPVILNDYVGDYILHDQQNDIDVHIGDIKSDNYVLACYLSSYCEGCITSLPIIKKINAYFKSHNIKTILIWEDKIPTNRLQSVGIDSLSSYTTKTLRLPSKPSFFIYNNMHRALITDTSDADTVITTLITLCNKYDIANDLINDIADISDASNECTVLLTNSNCEACDEARSYLDSARIENVYDVDIQSFEGLTLSRIFDIDMTPGFIVHNDNQNLSFHSLSDFDRYIKAGRKSNSLMDRRRLLGG